MSIPYTTEQILGLAPNYYHIKSSRGMASVEKWQLLARTADAAWGEFIIRNKSPIRAAVDLAHLTFSCTCRGRRFPCTHALALTLLLQEQPDSFDLLPSPEWLQEWLAAHPAGEYPPGEHPADNRLSTHEIATQIQKRQQSVERGLQELKLWLHDLVRGGFAQARTKPPTYWNNMANRLVDAQAGEVARAVKRLPIIFKSGPNWPEELLTAIGKLYLLIQGYEHFSTLDLQTQADLRGAVGWYPRRSTVDALGQSCRDRWFILGKRLEEQRKQKIQRIWLWGRESNRPALLVNVTYNKEPIDTSLLPGTFIDAELRFFPSKSPLRAQLVHQDTAQETTASGNPMDGNRSIRAAMAAYAQALSANPWIQQYPLVLNAVQIHRQTHPTGNRWFVQDDDGYLLPLPPKFLHGWHLASLAKGAQREGAAALSLFGEWDGKTLTPLSIWTHGRNQGNDRFFELHLLRGLK